MSEKSFPLGKYPVFSGNFVWNIFAPNNKKGLLQNIAAVLENFEIAGSVFQQFVDLGEDFRNFSHSAFANITAGKMSAGRSHKINVP